MAQGRMEQLISQVERGKRVVWVKRITAQHSAIFCDNIFQISCVLSFQYKFPAYLCGVSLRDVLVGQFIMSDDRSCIDALLHGLDQRRRRPGACQS